MYCYFGLISPNNESDKRNLITSLCIIAALLEMKIDINLAKIFKDFYKNYFNLSENIDQVAQNCGFSPLNYPYLKNMIIQVNILMKRPSDKEHETKVDNWFNQ